MTIFISRSLAPDSVFAEKLASYPLQAFSLLELQPLPLPNPLPKADWYFFYSPAGLRFFLDQSPLPPNTKIGLLGPGTAKAAPELQADFLGDGVPENCLAEFDALSSGQTVAFFRAQESRQYLQKHLSQNQTILDIVLYQNQIAKDFPDIQAQILVLTSPLNARAYHQRYGSWTGKTVVAIGQSTAAALESLACPSFHIAANPSEEALAQTVLALI